MEFQEVLEANETIVSVIALGYATRQVSKPKRKTPDEILKFL